MSTPKKKTSKRSHHAKPQAPTKEVGKSTAMFARRMREERTSRGVSQKELAEAVDLTISYVSMLENAKRSPPLDTLDRIAESFSVHPTALLRAK